MPVDRGPVPTRFVEREQRLAALLRMRQPQPLLVRPVLGVEQRFPALVEQIREHADHSRRIEDVQGRLRVLRGDPDRRVLSRGRRAANEERESKPAPLHLLRDVDHLVERRRDEAREPHDVAVLLDRRVEDGVRGDHHPEIENLVPVAAEHDADDVLADVMDVALHGREHHPARRLALLFLRLHERLEVGDRPLHGTGTLHDLREEHLPLAEEVADDLHPVHERTLDHVERPVGPEARLLRVLLDVVHDPVHQSVRKAIADRGFAPRDIELPPRCASGDSGRVLDEPFGRLRIAVEENVLDALEQRRLDVLVHGELPRVHDAHVEPGADRVVEERSVHRLANGVVPAKREREVRDPAGDESAGAALLEEGNRFDERLREAGVLFDPGGDCQTRWGRARCPRD